MTSLQAVGIWCAHAGDDAASQGWLTALRQAIAGGLSLTAGQPDVRLYDANAGDGATTGHPGGFADLAQRSCFMVVLLTPDFLLDPACSQQVSLVRARMARLGRGDMIVPLHILDVDAFETVRRHECADPAGYDFLCGLRWVDLRPFYRVDPASTPVRVRLDRLAARVQPLLAMELPEQDDDAEAPVSQAVLAGSAPPPPPPAPPAAWDTAPPARPIWKRTGVLVVVALLAVCVTGLLALRSFQSGPTVAPVHTASSGPECLICIDTVLIPAGQFMMGIPDNEDERENVIEKAGKPRHPVNIPKSFYIAKYTITRQQFAYFVTATGPRPPGSCWVYEKTPMGILEWQSREDRDWANPGFAQTDRDPVVCVNVKDVEDYAAWLSKQTDQKFRLPNDAEWEYAARAGTTTARYWGDGQTDFCAHANMADLSLAGLAGTQATNANDFAQCDDTFPRTAPVGSFPPNPWGLYDMIGNVWQWTADAWHPNYNDAPTDGSAWLQDGAVGRRSVRGGSWSNNPGRSRAGIRNVTDRGLRYSGVGFRLVREIAEVKK